MNLDGLIMKHVFKHVYLVVGVYLWVTLSGEGYYVGVSVYICVILGVQIFVPLFWYGGTYFSCYFIFDGLNMIGALSFVRTGAYHIGLIRRQI